MNWREWWQWVGEVDVYDGIDAIRKLHEGFWRLAEALDAIVDTTGLCPVCDCYGDHAAGCKVGEARDWLVVIGEGVKQEEGS